MQFLGFLVSLIAIVLVLVIAGTVRAISVTLPPLPDSPPVWRLCQQTVPDAPPALLCFDGSRY